MGECNILFDNILLRSKVDCPSTLQTEKALQIGLKEEINQVFSGFGWEVYFWMIKESSLYWYFNGNANSIMEHGKKKAEEIIRDNEFRGISEKRQTVGVKTGNYPFGVPYEILESILNGSNVLFLNAIKSVINKSKGTSLTNFMPWLWLKGISMYIITSPALTNDIRKVVYKKFKKELLYIDKYDKKYDLNMKKRFIISKSNDIAIIEIKLRFSDGEAYLLTMSESYDNISQYYDQYKGITKIFNKMLKFVWVGEYRQAFSYLVNEEKKAIRDENKQRKIADLHLSLEKFVKYKQLKERSNLFMFSWDNVPGKDSKRLIRSLMDDYNLGWAGNAKISKLDEGKIIHISKDKNSAEIMIDVKKKKATLKIRGGRTHILKVKNKNGKLNIYEQYDSCSRERKLASLISELKKSGFSGMYKISIRDLRVFEFKVSELISVINRICNP
jgi:TusA-related sulfurtransferase